MLSNRYNRAKLRIQLTMLLSEVSEGNVVYIAKISLPELEIRRLNSLGVTAGARVRIILRAKKGSVIAVDGMQIGLSKLITATVEVEL